MRAVMLLLQLLLAASCGKPEASPRPSPEQAAAIGVDWEWQTTRYGNDTQAEPNDPARYRLRLDADGSVRVVADCNHAGGSYDLEGSSIKIGPLHSTMAACEPGSLDSVFLRDLAAAAILFLRNDHLYLDLKYDSGTMEFERHPSEAGNED